LRGRQCESDRERGIKGVKRTYRARERDLSVGLGMGASIVA